MKKTTKIFGLLLTLFGLALVTGCNLPTNALNESVYSITIPEFENGTVSVDKKYALADETVTLTAFPAEGYKLENITVNDGKVSLSGEGNTRVFKMPESDVVVNAFFIEDKIEPNPVEETTYTVTFKDGDITIESKSVKSGEKVEKPADPTKAEADNERYSFAYWYTSDNPNSAFDFDTEITSDITLYAKWNTTALYSITITSSASGTVTADKTIKITAGETITLTVTPNDGYELATLTVTQGITSVTVTDNQFTMPAGNVTVSATFKLIKYKVTYAAYTENGVEILSESTANFEPGTTLDKEVSISDVAYVKYSGTMGNVDITLEPELWFKAEIPVEFYYKETLGILINDGGI